MNNWDIWQLLSEAFQVPLFTVNQTPITLSSLIIFFSLLGVLLLINRTLRRIMSTRVLPQFQLPTGTQYTVIRITQYIIWFIGGFRHFNLLGST